MPDTATLYVPALHFHHMLALDYFVRHGVVMAESIGEEHDDGDAVLGFKRRHSHQDEVDSLGGS